MVMLDPFTETMQSRIRTLNEMGFLVGFIQHDEGWEAFLFLAGRRHATALHPWLEVALDSLIERHRPEKTLEDLL